MVDEEQGNGTGKNEVVQEQQTTVADDFASQATSVLEFLSEDTIKQLQDEHKKLSTGVDKKSEEEAAAKVEADSKKAAEEAAAKAGEEGADGKGKKDPKKGEGEEGKDDPKNTDDDKKNIFGLNKGKGAKENKTEIVIENADQIAGAIKAKFGQEIKGINELPKFFETVKKWRTSAQELEKFKEENEEYKGLLESQPAEIIEAMKLNLQGKDYLDAFKNKPKFDFGKGADKQDVKALVEHYYPGEFTEEDFKEETESKTLKIAKASAIDKFTNEKTNRDNRTRQIHEDAAKRQQAFKHSVDGSVQDLSQSFPDTDSEALTQVKAILEGGVEKMISVFLNKDGTVKKDAAKRFMLAMHGEAQIEYMMGIASTQAESKTNEEILSRGADTPGLHKKSGGGKGEEISKEVQDKIKELKGLQQKKTF